MFSNKKAAGEVISALIMFIAVISVSTGLVIAFKNYALETQDSFNFQNDLANSKLKTSLSISHVYYNSTSSEVVIYLKNVGETKLKPSNFDLFIDEVFYTNFSYVSASDLTTIKEIFSPQDTIAIIQDLNLDSGSHEIRIVTDLGVGVEDSFNI